MSNSTIQIAPNSTGALVQTFQNTISASVVQAQAQVPVDTSGLTLSQNPGSAIPASALMVGGSDGTNLQAISTTSAGVVNVLATGTTLASAATGGATLYKFRDLKATVQAVKASAGTLYSVQIVNVSGATAYVQVFNVASGSVSLNTTTPDQEFLVATGAIFTANFGPLGIAYGTAISIASTTGEYGSSASASGVEVFMQYA